MVGQTVASYRILSLLGRGGMGVVYLAEHQTIGRMAAIKFLLPEFTERSDLVRRFLNEARAANRINHRCIIDVYDFGSMPELGVFLVMEYLDGESLRSLLRRRKMLPPAEVADIVRQMTSALGAAHAHSIIHRDLKPENVFLVDDDANPGNKLVKILDFGMAKLLEDDDLFSTPGNILGTPAYMAPEYIRGKTDVDARADVYSVGVIAYEALCGRPPFVAESLSRMFNLVSQTVAPPPSRFNRRVSPEVEQVLLRSLAKDPGDRFESMEALGDAFAEAAAPGSAAVASGAKATNLGFPRPSFVKAGTDVGELVRSYEEAPQLSMESGHFVLAPQLLGRRLSGALDQLDAREARIPGIDPGRVLGALLAAHRAVKVRPSRGGRVICVAGGGSEWVLGVDQLDRCFAVLKVTGVSPPDLYEEWERFWGRQRVPPPDGVRNMTLAQWDPEGSVELSMQLSEGLVLEGVFRGSGT